MAIYSIHYINQFFMPASAEERKNRPQARKSGTDRPPAEAAGRGSGL